MKYKEKHMHHLRRALGAVALSAVMLIPVGCTEKKEKVDQREKQGLMDPTPIHTHDKYNSGVTLYLVNIPLYERNGARKQDQYVLTRGLGKSEYRASGLTVYTRKAFINGSKEPKYVPTDENGAVYIERETETGIEKGFAGLFVGDDGEVYVVADENVSDFIKEREQQRIQARAAVSGNSVERVVKATEPEEITDSIRSESVADSLNVDTIKMSADSIFNAKVEKDTGKVHTDTLNMIRQDVRE